MTTALMEAGQAAAAQAGCAEGLAQAKDVGDLLIQAEYLWLMAELDLRTGRLPGAGTHLRESLNVATQIGDRVCMLDCLNTCGHLCAATGRRADALTLWAAKATHIAALGMPDLPQDAHRRQQPQRQASQDLGPARTQQAIQRGAAMTLATATQYAALLAAGPAEPAAAPGVAQLSPRERELVILVARGVTDAQIAEQLFISVRTVRSHLDRIRDKTGCRRRADLTRLALQAGLI